MLENMSLILAVFGEDIGSRFLVKRRTLLVDKKDEIPSFCKSDEV